MKQYWDLRYLKISLYVILVVVISILTYRVSSNTDNILPNIYYAITDFLAIFSPIIYGLLIAYLMNPTMIFFEKQFIKWLKPTTVGHFKKIRILCIIIVYACLFSTLFFSIRFLVPEIFANVNSIISNSSNYVETSRKVVAEIQSFIMSSLPYAEVETILNDVFDPTLITNFFSITNITNIVDSIISGTMSLTGLLLDWIIGFVIAIYALMQKETFTNGTRRLVYACLKQSVAQKIIYFFSDAHQTIIKFFVGKSLDSFIIGIICFIGLSFLDNPYALLLALIVGISNMIPYFGPFIGAVPAVILTLFEGIPEALLVLLFILALQQFDGLWLGPKILGESIGITPFWIISAITIGGALWGPLGMFFASPILAVILSVMNKWMDLRLSDKLITLPKLSSDEIIPDNPSYLSDMNLFKKKKPL